MASDRGPFTLDNPWPRIGWWSTAGLLAIAVILGFIVLGREQQNGPTLGTWTAICRALGITADIGPAGEPQPPLRTPSRIAWTSATLAQVAGGNAEHGPFVALNCTACHGPGDHKLGAPQLKTQQPAYIERQLAAFAQGFRQNDINEQMRTIAAQLTPDEMHVIAEFYGTGAAVAQVAER